MKTVRMFSIALVVAIFMTTVVPFAASSAAAMEIEEYVPDYPGQLIPKGPSSRPLPGLSTNSLPEVVLRVESANGVYGCTLIRQSPGDWFNMKPRQTFDVSWTVQNTGAAVWHGSATKFAYVGGTKMQTHGDEFGIGQDVGRGGKIKLSIDMTAPKAPGVYSTLWALYSGNTRFCKVTLSVSVSR